MGNDRSIEEKLSKTAAVFAVVETISLTLTLIDSRVGLAFAIGANIFTLYKLHDFGHHRRAGANAVNNVHGLFAARTGRRTHDAENAIRNVINGGAYVFDEAAQLAENFNSTTPRR